MIHCTSLCVAKGARYIAPKTLPSKRAEQCDQYDLSEHYQMSTQTGKRYRQNLSASTQEVPPIHLVYILYKQENDSHLIT